MKIFILFFRTMAILSLMVSFCSFHVNAMEASEGIEKNPEECPICAFEDNEKEGRPKGFLPCFYEICSTCAKKIKECPICRSDPKKLQKMANNLLERKPRDTTLGSGQGGHSDLFRELAFEGLRFAGQGSMDSTDIEWQPEWYRRNEAAATTYLIDDSRGGSNHRQQRAHNGDSDASPIISGENNDAVTNKAIIEGWPLHARELHYGCMQGDLQRVKNILESVDNNYEIVSAPDKDGYTALHCAATRGNKEIILMLINILGQRKGEIQRILSSRNIRGFTPLGLAKLRHNRPDDTTEVIGILELYNK